MLRSSCFISLALLCLFNIGIAEAYDNVDVATSDDIARNVMSFGLNLMQKINANYNKISLFSPLSIMSALAMLLLGSKGRSYSELAPLFGQVDTVRLHEQFGMMLRDAQQPYITTTSPNRQLDPWHSDSLSMSLRGYPVNRNDAHILYLANGLFVQQGFSINPNYKLVIY